MLNKNLVLIKIDEDDEKDSSGIFVQEEWKTTKDTGEVTAVADNVDFCKVGDRVFFNKYAVLRTPHSDNIRITKSEDIYQIL